MQAHLATAFARLTQAVNRAAAPSWGVYVFWPSTAVGSTAAGAVRSHTKGGQTVYRLIPSPYNAAQDGFYSTFTGGVLGGLITSRG